MVALFVLLTFILFIVVDIFVLKAQKKEHPAFQSADSPVFSKKSFGLLENIFISPGHTWARLAENGYAEIGVDDFTVKALGKISLNNKVEEGNTVRKGEVVFEGRVGDKSFDFRSPLTGTVKSVSTDLPEIIEEPYKNWAICISPSNLNEDIKNLFTGSALNNWLNQEFTRLRDFLNFNMQKPEMVGQTMLDGGNIVEGAVTYVNEKGQKNFEKQFLTF